MQDILHRPKYIVYPTTLLHAHYNSRGGGRVDEDVEAAVKPGSPPIAAPDEGDAQGADGHDASVSPVDARRVRSKAGRAHEDAGLHKHKHIRRPGMLMIDEALDDLQHERTLSSCLSIDGVSR